MPAPYRLRQIVRATACALALSLALPAQEVSAQELRYSAFAQTVAEAAARDDDLAAFYRARNFEGIWSGEDEEAQARRNLFLAALSQASVHGLPDSRFSADAALSLLIAAQTPEQKAKAEVEMSRMFLDYARALNNGLLEPRSVVSQIRREVQYRDRAAMLNEFVETPAAMLRSLPPSSPEYQRLMRQKLRLEALIADGGFGPDVQSSLQPGASGEQVVLLRNRLMKMGLLDFSVTRTYDSTMVDAVKRFQESVNMSADGVVGGATLSAINMPATERLKSVLVAMERERWLNNLDRGDRHVWVNLADFSTAIMDFGAVTFRTKSIVGAVPSDRQTVEFSDMMEYMEINPYWYVPRSIIMAEYGGRVPAGFQALDSRGNVVSVGSVLRNGRVVYNLRQPPGPTNALGRVKFMFPNQYAIYLHDTPTQSLFTQAQRTFSYGCVRLDDPYDFAYELLRPQVDDPVSYFTTRLNSEENTRVSLETPLPVHLIYRTAFTDVTGQLHFRNDVYGRDARIWSALSNAGVVVGGTGG